MQFQQTMWLERPSLGMRWRQPGHGRVNTCPPPAAPNSSSALARSRTSCRRPIAWYPCCRSQAVISACSKSTQEPEPKWSYPSTALLQRQQKKQPQLPHVILLQPPFFSMLQQSTVTSRSVIPTLPHILRRALRALHRRMAHARLHTPSDVHNDHNHSSTVTSHSA